MKKNSAALKGEAREVLLGNYGVIIMIFLLVQLISLVISNPFTSMIEEGYSFQVMSRICIGLLGRFLAEIVTTILTVGMLFVHLNLARGKAPKITDVFVPFRNRPDRLIGVSILLIIIETVSLIPGVLLILISLDSVVIDSTSLSFPLAFLVGIGLLILGLIITIYFSLAFSQTFPILLDDAEITALNAMSNSMRLMKGNKWRLIRLFLSFIGLFLLCVCTIGIGFLWVAPYVNQSLVQFYLDLIPHDETAAEPRDNEPGEILFK